MGTSGRYAENPFPARLAEMLREDVSSDFSTICICDLAIPGPLVFNRYLALKPGGVSPRSRLVCGRLRGISNLHMTRRGGPLSLLAGVAGRANVRSVAHGDGAAAVSRSMCVAPVMSRRMREQSVTSLPTRHLQIAKVCSAPGRTAAASSSLSGFSWSDNTQLRIQGRPKVPVCEPIRFMQ